MVEAGNKMMVCLSGGADSCTDAGYPAGTTKASPISFELVAVNLDQKKPDFPEHILPEYLDRIKVPYHILEQDAYSIVTDINSPR